MKANTIIVILLVVVIAAGVFFFVKSKKKGDTAGGILDILGKKLSDFSDKPMSSNVKGSFVGDTSKSISDKDWLRDALGLGETYLSAFSESDATIAREYIENYMRKGQKMLPSNPLYNDVVRIASFPNPLFPKP